MRIATIRYEGRTGLAVRRDNELIDLSIAAPALPATMRALLNQWDRAVPAISRVVAEASGSAIVDPARVEWLPVVTDPGKILCLGLNYVDHATESNFDKPAWPVVFARFPSGIIGHGASLIAPSRSPQFDYEAEMAVIIGRAGRNVSRAAALDLVAGYSVFNDGSVRDYQFKSHQWTVGKNFDGTGSFGPEMVTADELPPGGEGLRIATRLNGTVLQDANTSDMIFGVAETIALLSEAMTLEPGDVIVMGTPAGVGLARRPQIFMKPGDVCEIEIERIGTLRNPVIAEAATARGAA